MIFLRGGVEVGDIGASKLHYNCEFEIVIPRKLTAPSNQEIAIGTVMVVEENGGEPATIYLNDDLINELIGHGHLEKEKLRQIRKSGASDLCIAKLKRPHHSGSDSHIGG